MELSPCRPFIDWLIIFCTLNLAIDPWIRQAGAAGYATGSIARNGPPCPHLFSDGAYVGLDQRVSPTAPLPFPASRWWHQRRHQAQGAWALQRRRVDWFLLFAVNTRWWVRYQFSYGWYGHHLRFRLESSEWLTSKIIYSPFLLFCSILIASSYFWLI